MPSVDGHTKIGNQITSELTTTDFLHSRVFSGDALFLLIKEI